MSNSKEFILIIEDEESIGDGLVFNFEAEGYKSKLIPDGLEALSFLRAQHEDVSMIILDLMLPHVDGYEILAQTRILAEKVPILILSAKSMESEKIKAFELGADDFVTKPFHLMELILRVKRLLKHSNWYHSEEGAPKRFFGGCVFDSSLLTLEDSQGTIVRVSPMEALLIQVFLDCPDRILSRGDLLQKVWQCEATMETRTVDVFVSKLRKYIEKNPSKPEHLISVRGLGYRYISKK